MRHLDHGRKNEERRNADGYEANEDQAPDGGHPGLSPVARIGHLAQQKIEDNEGSGQDRIFAANDREAAQGHSRQEEISNAPLTPCPAELDKPEYQGQYCPESGVNPGLDAHMVVIGERLVYDSADQSGSPILEDLVQIAKHDQPRSSQDQEKEGDLC